MYIYIYIYIYRFPVSGRISEWTLAQFRLPAGRHSVTWRYQKDIRGV